jgi:hypothetical protein
VSVEGAGGIEVNWRRIERGEKIVGRSAFVMWFCRGRKRRVGNILCPRGSARKSGGATRERKEKQRAK